MESKSPVSGHSFEAKSLGHEYSPESNESVGVEVDKTPSFERREIAAQGPVSDVGVVQLPKVSVQKQGDQDNEVVLDKRGPESNKEDVSSNGVSKDGLIEKEWVDRAKKVIAETKTDPYEQERKVSRLQADYLRERYGKDVKVDS